MRDLVLPIRRVRYICRCIACFTLIDSLRKLRLSVRRVSYSSQFVACVMFVGASRLLCLLVASRWLVGLVGSVALVGRVVFAGSVALRCVALRCVGWFVALQR